MVARIVIANALTGGATYLLREQFILIPIAAAIAVYAVLLFSLRIISKADLLAIKQIVFKRKTADAQ